MRDGRRQAAALPKFFPTKGIFDESHGLPFGRMMDAAYGKGFGGDTKADRVAMKKSVDCGVAPVMSYQPSTNIQIGLVVQDSVYQDWMVTGESHQHEGLSQRFQITFGRSRMVGLLKHKRFAEHVYKPMVKGILANVLRWVGHRQSIKERGTHDGVFDFSDSDERLVKNVRMICSHFNDQLDSARRQKLLTGLSKSGYWLPLVAWENQIMGTALNRYLDASEKKFSGVVSPTRIPSVYLSASIIFWARFFLPLIFRKVCFQP